MISKMWALGFFKKEVITDLHYSLLGNRQGVNSKNNELKSLEGRTEYNVSI